MTKSSARNTTRAKKRPAPRRRIHRGRMALLLSIVAIIVIFVMICLSRCSTNDSIRHGGDFRTPVPDAIEAGRADAIKVMKTSPGTMERDNALLFIRSRESELRMAGYGHAADDYINAANEYLNTHNILK